jgi:hypothetical protein
MKSLTAVIRRCSSLTFQTGEEGNGFTMFPQVSGSYQKTKTATAMTVV